MCVCVCECACVGGYECVFGGPAGTTQPARAVAGRTFGVEGSVSAAPASQSELAHGSIGMGGEPCGRNRAGMRDGGGSILRRTCTVLSMRSRRWANVSGELGPGRVQHTPN